MQTAFGIAVPAQEIVGILIFWSRDRRPQDDPVIETLIAITSQLGQFIQRKRTETALIESEANLAEAQAISHLGSWELTLATQTMTGSDEFFRILSIDPQIQSFTYLNFVEYIHPDERQTWVTSIERALTQRSTYELDFRIVRTDAAGNRTTRYLNSRGKTICNAQGEPVRLIGTVMDITERKHAEMATGLPEKTNRTPAAKHFTGTDCRTPQIFFGRDRRKL
uniref:PAS domain-containing protein n=1 Tax=Desertifilum tharense IPPAS B-1220 TaxID=1781255 RepID=A0ACD5GQE3_9CYAN